MSFTKSIAGTCLALACTQQALAQVSPPAVAQTPSLAAAAAPAPVPPVQGATHVPAAHAIAAVPPATATAPDLAPRPDDELFTQLRDAARNDDADQAARLSAQLGAYPAPAYVEYYRLKPRLRQAAVAEIRDFLNRYQGSAIADRLRNDWLLELGRARDWTHFDQQLPLFVLNDDLQVKCYALTSRALKGEPVADEARALLQNPPAYGEGCATLIATLTQLRQFSHDDLAAQLRLAGEYRATGPARRLAALLGASETQAARAIDLPAVAMARGIGNSRADREVYLLALSRMARTSLRLATTALNNNTPRLGAQEVAAGWASIAHAASLTLAPEALGYWARAQGAPLTHEQMQWKTRIALRQGDWKTVKATILSMPPQLRNQNVWVYWLARAMQAEGVVEAAQAAAQYQRIAEPNSFYGQLALEELGQKIALPIPAAVTPEEVAAVAANPGLRRALKFFSLRMRLEGGREWTWELRKFNDREVLAAAELARQHGILDRMVSTSERSRTLFDYSQRYPSPHRELLHPTTSQLNLDQAWVYGLIRQESRFITDAQSSVGASGLMQVMPATAQYVARKIGLDFVKNKLNDLRTNLVLGANYMNMVLINSDGSQVLASAAYNAGPSRMRAWRGSLAEPVEGAVFAETIPFTETRIYVKNVMSNATNYAALFENRPQSLKARLGRISPRGPHSGDTELP